MFLFVVCRALDGSVSGEVLELCSGCVALLGMEEMGPNTFLSFGPDSVVEEARWGVLCETEDGALFYKASLGDDGPSASKRFSAEKGRENARNRRAEEGAITRNRREDRRAAMLDRE